MYACSMMEEIYWCFVEIVDGTEISLALGSLLTMTKIFKTCLFFRRGDGWFAAFNKLLNDS